MKRSAAILIAALSALAAAAGEVVSVGTDGSQDFSYHARYALHGNGKHALGMYWDCADTLHYELIAEIDNSAFNDAMYPAKVRYTITKKIGTSGAIVSEGAFDCRQTALDNGFSIVLRRTPSGAVVSLGAEYAAATEPVEYCGDSIRTEGISGAQLKRHSLIVRGVETARDAKFASADELYARIAARADAMEGVWEYLDRDIDAARARLGQKYTLFCVRTDTGYDLLTLDGVDGSPVVKGKLVQTAFEEHYDLRWLSTDGYIADTEASAAVAVEGEVLELNFPNLGSRLRFRRRH